MKSQKFAFFILLLLVNTCVFSFAQAPQKVSYQTVIRDASGELVRSQPVGMQISILQGSASGTAVYVETHTSTTNINGLASVEVGNGTPVSGNFSDIDWSESPYFLKVETDPTGGMSYSITGTTEILSIPYALYAKTAETVETETQGLSDVLGESNDGNATQIKNIADPTDDQDAATKMYVDNLLSTIQIVQNGFVDPRDGNHYSTVLIGNQLWMAENLAYLPEVSPPADGSEDGDGTESYYYVYGYSGTDISAAKATSNYQTYGVLYNWPAATTACPSGWHLPTDAEWTILTDYLENNGYGYGGSGDDIAKSMAATENWAISTIEATPGKDPSVNNSSGFDGQPGGWRNHVDEFSDFDYVGCWWSATELDANYAWRRYLVNTHATVYQNYFYKECGYSVRCVKDE
ncbi:MAG: hypothetical protein K9H26_09305 [Prolixibacteraceae bacterium]|nr:hypothetical protein [Prolixibacteraceae bacterium]